MTEAYAALPRSFEGLLEACVSFHGKSKNKASEERTRVRRADLARFAKLFHTECGTLTPSVQESIGRLENGNCIVLMTAHQPNFFAYSGVLRKATLIHVLAKKLESALRVPVVSFFGIADQDFTDDRWVRSCELPSVLRSGGVLSLEVKLPEKLMLNKVAKPSHSLLASWESEVKKWLDDAVRSITRLYRTMDIDRPVPVLNELVLEENFASFWKLAETSWDNSKNFADFNGFLISKIVNDIWEYDAVFARFSECQQAFADDFSFLLSRFDDYSRLMKEAMTAQSDAISTGGVSDQEPCLVPFWYHCSCGSKVKLFLSRKDDHLFGAGSCVRCQKSYNLDLGNAENPNVGGLSSQVSARAIPMALVFFRGLQPCCYVGGAGGVGYLGKTDHIAKGLEIEFPPIAVWRPRDRYMGVGQAEALLELKRICGYVGTENLSEAKDLLRARVSEARNRIDDLEKLRSSAVERLKKNPHDAEARKGLNQVLSERSEALKSSNLSVVCHEVKILENGLNCLNLVPSIIDYAINCGLKETSFQWVRYLDEIGDFCSDVKMVSVIDSGLRLEEIV